MAALLPPIHADLWKEYGANLPSDESLRYRLVGQRGFTETGFRDFIKEYRETISFAQMTSGFPSEEPEQAEAAVPERVAPAFSQTGADAPTRAAQPKVSRGTPSGLMLPIPLVGGYAVTLEGEFPVSEAAWLHFMAVLAALKPGLVTATVEGDEGDR